MAYLEKKQKKKLEIFSIVVIILFLIGITTLIIKDIGDGTCASTRNKQISHADNIFLGLDVIDTTIYSQEIKIDNQEINYYEYYLFCFRGSINSSDPLKVDLYNNGELLSTNYFNNGSKYFCFDIGSQDFKVSNNFLGISCSNCNGVDNNLEVYTSTSNFVPTISSSGFSNDLQIDYVLIGVKNCQKFIYQLFKYMFLFILLMSLILGLDVFIDFMKGLMLRGW